MIAHRQNKKISQTISKLRKAKSPLKAPQGGRPEAYPWSEWFDGKTRKLIRGSTYHCSDKSMQKNIYSAASRHQFHVAVQVVEDGIILSPKKLPDPATAELIES